MINTRDTIAKEIHLRLGGNQVEVELDPENYDLAITKSIEKYRQRSDNAYEESFIVLKLEVEKTNYRLPDEVITVKKIYRRATGITTGSGMDFEPFEAQFLNYYLLNSGRAGGLAVYDALAQHRELLGRMFGADLNFTWNSVTKTLFLQRFMKGEEDVFVHVYNMRPEEQLFQDNFALPWIKDYAYSHSKWMLGDARSKFTTYAGPQGGTSLNGEVLKTEANAEIERLEQDLKNFVEGSGGYGFLIG
jgi:hypothetical protein